MEISGGPDHREVALRRSTAECVSTTATSVTLPPVMSGAGEPARGLAAGDRPGRPGGGCKDLADLAHSRPVQL